MLKSRGKNMSNSKAKRRKRVIIKAAELSRAHGKGSISTRESAYYALDRFTCVCKSELNIQINDVGDIRSKTAYEYVKFMRKRGVSKKTLQNHFSHIRNYFRNAKLPLHLIPSNHDLGISGAPRRGTHKALHMQDFEAANVNVDGNKIIINKGILLAIRLQIWLGLRRKEAIFAYKNLPFWRAELTAGCHRISILGSAGPKNGRPRTITISDHILEPVVELVKELSQWVRENNQVIVSGKSAKAAMRAYSKAINSLGFRMPYSTHSFRYGWTINQYKWYISQGYTSKMALMRLAEDLGHGSNRTQYVKSVYLREIFHPDEC